MIYVKSQIRFTIGLNRKFIRTGFFVVKHVGILFLNIMIILTVAQESQMINNPVYSLVKLFKSVEA